MAHDQEIMGSNPGTVYWMDVSDASYYIIEKLKIKVAKWGTPKKKKKKKKVAECPKLTIFMKFHQVSICRPRRGAMV
jgi:hypothetical protein